MRTLAEIGSIDFAPDATKRRIDDMMRPITGIGGELLRFRNLLQSAEGGPMHELHRTEHAAATFATIGEHELGRMRDLPRKAPAPPTIEQFTMQFAEDLVALPMVLGLDRMPLREADDREFRTSPDDTRPEKTLWQRLQRRLFP